MKISQEAIAAIKNNNRVKARLMLEFSKTHRAVDLWIEKNSLVLTTPGAIAIIKKETGLSEAEILIDETQTEKV